MGFKTQYSHGWILHQGKLIILLFFNLEFAAVNSLTQTLPRSWSSSYSRSLNSRSFNSIYNQKQQVTRVQRGDQGPDDTGGDLSDNLDFINTISSSSSFNRVEQLRGPNVCRSGGQSTCCSGWSQRGRSGLCLNPICNEGSCGQRGRCIKPGLCMCEGGKISPRCKRANSFTSSGSQINTTSLIGPSSKEKPRCHSNCINGGTCQNNICQCRSGYSGQQCQEPVCREDCKNGGRCIGPNRCACVYGYTGKYCEIDYRTGPCYREISGSMCSSQLEGVVCTKQLCCATIGVAWGHPCEKCPEQLVCDQPGFLKNVHTGKCMDINECEAIPGLCRNGECSNTIGSFTCTCPEGTVINDLHQCVDEDECENEGSGDICPNGKCINRDPGYFCECDPGFIPTQDQKACLDGRQGNCYTSLNPSNGRCRKKLPFKLSRIDCCCSSSRGRGSSSPMGVSWGVTRSECEPCPEVNTEEHEALCRPALNDVIGNICRGDQCGINFGNEYIQTGESHNNNICVTQRNICGFNGVCIPSNNQAGYSCQCDRGFVLNLQGTSCIDDNECRSGIYCRGGRCLNTIGGFQCECPQGSQPSFDRKSCVEQRGGDISGSCLNGRLQERENGTECVCNNGFLMSSNSKVCEDLDECAENPFVCLHGRCLNTKGSYVCDCQQGFSHTSDGGYCIDDNECSNNELACGENGRCVNTEGSYRCVCDPGFEVSLDKKNCLDINECRDKNLCSGGTCINTLGGFKCECLDGFTLGPDGRTCTDSVQGLCYATFDAGRCFNPSINMISKSTCCCGSLVFNAPFGWGTPCQMCPPPGSSDFYKLCPHGAGKTHGGDDINECVNDPCGESGACENIIGSYRCVCEKGYQLDHTGKKCIDIDECEDPNVCTNGGICRNFPGSFQCICPKGSTFNETSKICEDENECEAQMDLCGPNGKCINTQQGYKCECDPGWILDTSLALRDRKNSGGSPRCIDNRRGSCWTKINNGSCEANIPGTTLRSECCCASNSLGKAWGSPCERCNHTADCGGCSFGMMLSNDGNTCEDINECNLNPNLCQGGACINTEGGYLCRCPTGLSLDSSGTVCTDDRVGSCFLDNRQGICSKEIGGLYKKDHCCCTIGEGWGQSCNRCPRPGTIEFDTLCPQGKGFIPDIGDINECIAFPNVCTNGRCKNTQGGFVCRCNQGYALDEYGVKCVNIDECAIMQIGGVCGNGTCVDTLGSFKCECHSGFETKPLMTQVCMDIDECSEDPFLCRGGRCINTPGSFVCECPLGLELTEDGKRCKDIDECGRTSGVCSNGVCENMMGAYQCVCDEGFKQAGSGTNCVDENECENGQNGGCDDVCVNTPGSFSCACAVGYELLLDGQRCVDIDECSNLDDPCNGGKCINTPGGYSCVCSGGLMMGPDAKSCLDLDECAINNDVCRHGKCENTLGSFRCLCDDGYSVKALSSSQFGDRENLEEGCTDDDECALDLHHCDPVHAECKNTNGSYDCQCKTGFEGDGFDCHDINECSSNNGGCDLHATCVNTPGGFRCICDNGFSGDGFNCTDINECLDEPNLCENGACINTDGSFSCDCQKGFMHPAEEYSQACIDIDECSLLEGENSVCQNGDCKNLLGSFRCNCYEGYHLDSTGSNCTDNDECSDPQTCRRGECINNEGGYECQCPDSFELLPSGTGCVDLRTGNCYTEYNTTRNGLSVCGGDITKGGYNANSRSRGFNSFSWEGVTKSACCCSSVGRAWGVNECIKCPEPGTDEYDLICPGGKGFQPNERTVILEDIHECLEFGSALCKNGRCSNTFGSYMCMCKTGFQLDENGVTCIDIDECSDGRQSPCGLGGRCVNTEGGYQCLCENGYVLSPDGNSCIDMRKEPCYMQKSQTQCKKPMAGPQTKTVCCCSMGKAWGLNCESCPSHGGSDYKAMCGSGPPGVMVNPMTNQTEEIDECQLMPGMCQHGKCINTMGSFKCDCKPGYMFDEPSHQCIDKNECNTQDTGPPACYGLAQCVNTPGSFKCTCPDGYELDASGLSCVDIDECSGSDPICQNGECKNMEGSFQCTCNDGFILGGVRRNTCVDRDECALDPFVCGKNGTCFNKFGGFDCNCDPGFEMKPGTKECVDVDECKTRFDPCRNNGRCKNIPGDFICDCTDGYESYSNGHYCRDINECTRQDLNICPKPGRCINTPGSFICTCPDGYKLSSNGSVCLDINECLESNSELCIDGFCINTEGGVECECPQDWILTEDGSRCLDTREESCYDDRRNGICSNPRSQLVTRRTCCCTLGSSWGRDCSVCPQQGTSEFRELCPLGIGRSDNGEDFNECEMLEGLCSGGKCVNTDGSYRCECPKGYILNEDGKECVDENECAASNNRICGNGTCTNKDGGFECSCSAGFAPGPVGICEDINECVEDNVLCAFRCHNTPGSYRCVCPYGYAVAPDRMHCEDIDECSTEANDCRYDCKNLIGSFMCVCPSGFRKIGTTGSDECEDIDECFHNPDICGEGGECRNIQGSYRCDCNEGYESSADGTSCIDRRQGTCFNKVIGGLCRQLDVFDGTGSGDGIDGNPRTSSQQMLVTRSDCCCTMGEGWGVSEYDCEICPTRGTLDFDELCLESGFGSQGEDIDECKILPGLCANGQCINTMGSYRCICNRGFRADPSQGGKRCLDVDECRQRPAPCDHECTNTFGSYECSCPAGYHLHERNNAPLGSRSTCIDVDECVSKETNNCEYECLNIPGSYECVCPRGFTQLGHRCLDIDECVEQPGLCPPPGMCKNTLGGFRCVCPRGYTLDNSGTFCVDRNECSGEPSRKQNRCGSNALCKNSPGSYRCICPEGFILNSVFNECVDQNECAGGSNIASRSNSGDSNSSLSLRSLEGLSSSVVQDMNENICGTAQCQNSFGSFSCICPGGRQYDPNIKACNMMNGGCAQSPCAFGCQSNDNSGYTCGCPRGYRMIGAVGSGSNGHCIALNNIGNFLSSNDFTERSKFLVDFSNNENKNIISTEGCFACDMNKPNKRSKSRIASSKSREIGRRGRRLRSRRNLIRRKRRHKRNNRNVMTEATSSITNLHLNSQRHKRSASIDNLSQNLNENLNDASQQNLSSYEYEHSSFNTSHVERIAIQLSQEETRVNRPILFLQPSTMDEILNGNLVHYYVRGRDKDLFEIRRDKTDYLNSTSNENTGQWRLHYKSMISKNKLNVSPNKMLHHHIKVVGRKYNSHDYNKRKMHHNGVETFGSNSLKKENQQENNRHHKSEIELIMKLKLIITL